MCTCLRTKATNGAVVVGRTMEFAVPLGSQVCVLPRGFQGRSRGPAGEGKQWTARHGVVGVSAFGDVQTLADGMNETGLYAGDLYLPGFTEYASPEGRDPATLLAPTDLVGFVLGTCATVAEARTAMRTVAVWPEVVKAMGFSPPLHLVLHDASGDAAVLEWRDGEMVEFDNPIGVTTNSPHFDWHYLNLRNYMTLSPKNPTEIKIEGVALSPLGQGVGLSGLPGDTSPPSRFVRATAFVASLMPIADGPAAEKMVLHVMNNFDIPEGSVRTSDGSSVERTYWTSVSNLRDLHYVIRSFEDPTPRLIDLASTDFSAGARQVPLPTDGFVEMSL